MNEDDKLVQLFVKVIKHHTDGKKGKECHEILRGIETRFIKAIDIVSKEK